MATKALQTEAKLSRWLLPETLERPFSTLLTKVQGNLFRLEARGRQNNRLVVEFPAFTEDGARREASQLLKIAETEIWQREAL